MKMILIVLLTSVLLFEYNNSTNMRKNSLHINKTIPHVHNQDLMIQNRSHMSFVNYWADEKNGFIYQMEDHALVQEKEIQVTPGI